MKLLFIGCDSVETQPRYYEEYKDFLAGAASGDDIAVTSIEQLLIQCGDGELTIIDMANDQCALDTYDAVMYRGVGMGARVDVLMALSCYCSEHGMLFMNDLPRGYIPSKLAQAVFCHQNGLPMPRTTYVNAAVLTGHATMLRYPLVLKAARSAHGKDNFIVYSKEDIERITVGSSKRYVLQRLIPNDGDYRILIIGDETLVIGRHKAAGSHLSNTSQGGKARVVDEATLPAGLMEDARRFARTLDMTIAGVDAIIDKQTGDYYFLEINSQPQLTAGVFLAEKQAMVHRLLTRLRDEG